MPCWLAAEFQTTPVVAIQANGSLTTEQAAVLLRIAVQRAEASFQVEHGAQAVTQVFHTAHTKARTAAHALNSAETALLVAVEFNLLVTDTGVDQTVQSDRVSRLRRAGETGQQRHSQ